MGLHTPLYDSHLRLNAKLVDFAGWDMPIHYGSQIEEHHQVRKAAGMFDVSHMLAVELLGDNAKALLRKLLANDVAKLSSPGQALYSCMLNPQGGVIDDLICYYLADDHYRLVVNAGTREKDLAWINQHAPNLQVEVTARQDLSIIAVQGPQAREKVLAVLPADFAAKAEAIKRFSSAANGDWFVGRTGYTGEDGFEIMLPASEAMAFWQALLEQGVKPAGLGARDTLRLEAGMNLYGSDMDDETSPLEAGLAWTLALKDKTRHFIGLEALLALKQSGISKKLVGLVLQDRGVLRGHQTVVKDGKEIGEITSGSFSPTLGKSIAFARIDHDVEESCQVRIRNKDLTAMIVKPPFVKNGEAIY